MSNGPRLSLEFQGMTSSRYSRGFKATYSFTESKWRSTGTSPLTSQVRARHTHTYVASRRDVQQMRQKKDGIPSPSVILNRESLASGTLARMRLDTYIRTIVPCRKSIRNVPVQMDDPASSGITYRRRTCSRREIRPWHMILYIRERELTESPRSCPHGARMYPPSSFLLRAHPRPVKISISVEHSIAIAMRLVSFRRLSLAGELGL